MFLTTAEFLPQHRDQFTATRQLLDTAREHGQQRVVQMNERVETNLLAIITTLEQPQPGGSGCCSSAIGQQLVGQFGEGPGCGCTAHADRNADAS
jgi:hypothetical protein